ncbi:beta-N-acetylhexosaminidase [Natranaerovirga pectinivora]|uniref:beta-N-acetylhexosaminidase n=1 Tax=Natranaerovirga pectinivora TaxID=682400 RepID=A0A4R3MMY8_9FIRM|nr:glycoside hydrolase family 3 protein [Natranaerovirga pectinivora]TCT16353.1 beta-N-acetylhexosaminidase [Natranaerovirga pectinivora]
MKLLKIFLVFTIIFLVGCKGDVEQNDVGEPANEEQQQVDNAIEPNGEEEEDEEEIDPLAEMLNAMSLEEKVAQLFVLELGSINNGVQLTEMNDTAAAFLGEFPIGGVIFFQNNVVNVEQTSSFIKDLQGVSDIPLFVSVDEEGGIVSRIGNNVNMNATVLPSHNQIGRTEDPEYAFKVGQILGRELKALGFNMNFAPVADVNTNPNNPIIGNRAFGSEPESVAEMVASMVEGMQEEGVSAVIKHFPGHGDTSTDTHVGSTYVEHDIDRLKEIEWVPFQAGIEAGVYGIMTAHIQLPNVVENNLPATMSKDIITDLLREELEFDGLIITDALNMGAISNNFSMAEAAIEAILAGCDILLMPIPFIEAYNGVLEAIENGVITEERIDESVMRIFKVKDELGLFDEEDEKINLEEVLGSEEHKKVVEEIFEKIR